MADPVEMTLVWVAQHGWLGLVGVSLFERLVPVLPSHAVLVVLGYGCAQGLWGLPAAWLLCSASSLLGCWLLYGLGRQFGKGGLPMATVLRVAACFGIAQLRAQAWIEQLRSGRGSFALLSQLMPVLRELAPGFAGWMGVRPRAYFWRVALGILIWNGLFMGAGWLAAQSATALPAGSLAAIVLVGLLAGELLLLAIWRRRRHLQLGLRGLSRRARRCWRSDGSRFLRSYLRSPSLVGAIAPSGRVLGRLMTAGVQRQGPVIELGPGTGVFTRALLARGVLPQAMVLVEADAGFAAQLRQRFPQLGVLCMDAEWLAHSGGWFGAQRAACIVSGLPLLAMPASKALAIVKAAFQRHLRVDGSFYQFSYLPRCPLSARVLAAEGLCAERVGGTVLNLPPAFVYRISRCNAAASRPERAAGSAACQP